MDLHSGYIPEGLCLGAQFMLTTVSIIRIYDNRDQFPVRHFGPVSTITCALCFFFANIINLLGRIISGSDFDFKSCAINQNNVLFGLAILYNILRELPFGLFTVKTLRASLCFWPRFNGIKVQRINRHFVSILAHETYFIYLCVVYVCIVNVVSVIEAGNQSNQKASYFIYQYFCSKADDIIIEKVVAALRVTTMGFVFFLSVWTYDELDFKKFLIMIFFSANLFIIPHVFLVLADHITKRDSIYYTSYIIELLNTCIIMYYSGINKKLSQPAMQGVLQSWQAFHNLRFGMDVLYEYAIYRDENSTNDKKLHFQCLDHYDYLDEILKLANTRPGYNLEEEIQVIQIILQRNQHVKQKLGTAATSDLKRKCKEGTIKIEHLKKIEKILSNYCETTLFIEWKKTKSYKFLKQQLINNGDINEKLALFGIPIS